MLDLGRTAAYNCLLATGKAASGVIHDGAARTAGVRAGVGRTVLADEKVAGARDDERDTTGGGLGGVVAAEAVRRWARTGRVVSAVSKRALLMRLPSRRVPVGDAVGAGPWPRFCRRRRDFEKS